MRDEVTLKIFAGANPLAFLEPRRAWHREKLAELEDYLEEIRRDQNRLGSELTLIAGITYHRKMLEMFDELDPWA